MDDHKLVLLSKAVGNEGQLLYPNLTNDMGFIRPDIMSQLIEACQSRGWSFLWNATTQKWIIGDDLQAHGKIFGRGKTFTDALFKATAADPPPNWERCDRCFGRGQIANNYAYDAATPKDCEVCSGTGFILRSEGGQNV